jgi:transposase-like protein
MPIIEDQTHQILARTLNQALENELSEALGREPFERGSGGRYRNGSKPLSLPDFFGRLSLRKPVLCGATPASPLLDSLRRAGRELVGLLATRFWLRGTSTRATAQEPNAAFGTKLRSSMEITEANFEACLTFMREPQAFCTTLCTSNVIERFNREL